MTTNAPKTPATPYDRVLAELGPKSSVRWYERDIAIAQQLAYCRALADLAPLRRQMVEALGAEAKRCDRCRCDRSHHGQGGGLKLEQCWLCMVCADWRPNEAVIAAMDAARKAGL